MLLKFLEEVVLLNDNKTNSALKKYFFETNQGVRVVYMAEEFEGKESVKNKHAFAVEMHLTNQLFNVDYFKDMLKFKSKENKSFDEVLSKKTDLVVLSCAKEDFIEMNNFLKDKKLNVGSFYSLPLPKVILDNLSKAENMCVETIRNNVLIEKQKEINFQEAKNELALEKNKDVSSLSKDLFSVVVSCPDNELTAQKVIGLIKKGARFDFVNEVGDNAFILSCRKNMKMVANTIFEELNNLNNDYLKEIVGFDWNHQNNNGETAMFFVIKRGNDDLLEKMCVNDNLFDFHLKDKIGKSVFDLANDFKNIRIKNILTDKYEINIVQNKKRLQQGF